MEIMLIHMHAQNSNAIKTSCNNGESRQRGEGTCCFLRGLQIWSYAADRPL